MDLVYPGGRIYWSDPTGYSLDRQELDIGASSATTADLNRDGYLDLIFARGSYSDTSPDPQGVIVWGSGTGLHIDNSTDFPFRSRLPMIGGVADFNRDGFLDLIFTDVDAPNTEIFWGWELGTYTPQRVEHLKVHSASTVEIADLNADGWLDLILGAVYDPNDFGRPMRKVTLLWGSQENFSIERSLELEAYESEEQAVADLNKDGDLDIVMTN